MKQRKCPPFFSADKSWSFRVLHALYCTYYLFIAPEMLSTWFIRRDSIKLPCWISVLGIFNSNSHFRPLFCASGATAIMQRLYEKQCNNMVISNHRIIYVRLLLNGSCNHCNCSNYTVNSYKLIKQYLRASALNY